MPSKQEIRFKENQRKKLYLEGKNPTEAELEEMWQRFLKQFPQHAKPEEEEKEATEQENETPFWFRKVGG